MIPKSVATLLIAFLSALSPARPVALASAIASEIVVLSPEISNLKSALRLASVVPIWVSNASLVSPKSVATPSIAVFKAAFPSAPAVTASVIALESVVSRPESLVAKSDLRLVSVVPNWVSKSVLVVPRSVAKESRLACRASIPVAPAVTAASIFSDRLVFKFATSVAVAMPLVALVISVFISASVTVGLFVK